MCQKSFTILDHEKLWVETGQSVIRMQIFASRPDLLSVGKQSQQPPPSKWRYFQHFWNDDLFGHFWKRWQRTRLVFFGGVSTLAMQHKAARLIIRQIFLIDPRIGRPTAAPGRRSKIWTEFYHGYTPTRFLTNNNRITFSTQVTSFFLNSYSLVQCSSHNRR